MTRGDNLTPCAEIVREPRTPVTTPQAGRNFRMLDQVNVLVDVRDADPDRVFVARLMTLCSILRPNHRASSSFAPARLLPAISGIEDLHHIPAQRTLRNVHFLIRANRRGHPVIDFVDCFRRPRCRAPRGPSSGRHSGNPAATNPTPPHHVHRRPSPRDPFLALSKPFGRTR